MVEVHYYDPYDFTINTGGSIIEWGMYAKDASKTETWANESYADGQFQKMKTKFIDNGYGVILGEYGVIARLNLTPADRNATFAPPAILYAVYYTVAREAWPRPDVLGQRGAREIRNGDLQPVDRCRGIS